MARLSVHAVPSISAWKSLLDREEVLSHELVFGELLIGDRGGRPTLLASYEKLLRAPTVSHAEVVELVRSRKLQGRGVGWMDRRPSSCVRPRCAHCIMDGRSAAYRSRQRTPRLIHPCFVSITRRSRSLARFFSHWLSRAVPAPGVQTTAEVVAPQDDHFRPGPDRRVFASAARRSVQTGRRPGIRDRIVAAPGVDREEATAALAAPYEHFLASPHRGRKSSDARRPS